MAPALSSKDFGDCLETQFVADGAGGPAALLLVGLQQGANSARMESFSLLFCGPIAPYLPQGIYRLQHEKLGTMEMFLVPLGPDGRGMQYEAVFNRFRDSR